MYFKYLFQNIHESFSRMSGSSFHFFTAFISKEWESNDLSFRPATASRLCIVVRGYLTNLQQPPFLTQSSSRSPRHRPLCVQVWLSP